MVAICGKPYLLPETPFDRDRVIGRGNRHHQVARANVIAWLEAMQTEWTSSLLLTDGMIRCGMTPWSPQWIMFPERQLYQC